MYTACISNTFTDNCCLLVQHFLVAVNIFELKSYPWPCGSALSCYCCMQSSCPRISNAYFQWATTALLSLLDRSGQGLELRRSSRAVNMTCKCGVDLEAWIALPIISASNSLDSQGNKLTSADAKERLAMLPKQSRHC
jgi:hypothetical protein